MVNLEQYSYRLADTFENALKNDHKFIFSVDNPIPNKNNKNTKLFHSVSNIKEFLNELDQLLTTKDL
jgi:hypothetical protein